MTVCVFYRDVLAADTLTVASNTIVSSSSVKIGMIYEDALTGVRSLNPDTLKYPKEFAMYSFAGACAISNRFLRWFINTDHPFIDHQDFIEEDLEEVKEDLPFESMVIFKNHDIIRVYGNDYYYNYFIDQPKSELSSIGCGSSAVLAIHAYDSNASSTDIIKAVIRSDTFCGGNINTLSFSESDPEYDIKVTKPSKIKWKFW